MLPQISFSKIRTFNKSQNNGFEELSVQLFRHEFAEPFSVNRIQGSGGDRGTEAYANDPTDPNCIIGLQAKYFDALEDVQWKQIEKSVNAAIKNYPNLVRYIVAVPLDKTPTKTDKWNALVANWNNGRSTLITFIWWGQSEFIDLLSQKRHHGRLQYWFGMPEFDESWLQRKFESALLNLDHRYTPEYHIKTDTEKYLDVFVGVDPYQKEFSEGHIEIREAWDGFSGQCKNLNIINETQHLNDGYTNFEKGMLRSDSISNKLSLIPILEGIISDITPISELPCFTDPNNRHYVSKLQQTTRQLLTLCKKYLPFTKQNLLLLGEQGIGKSHLLANLVQGIIEKNGIGLLLLGESFVSEQDVSTSVLSLLDVQKFSLDELLSFLNVAAETTGTFAIICIDAINESSYRHIWKKTLLSFTAELSKYQNIKLVISCRSDFTDICIPDGVVKNSVDGWISHYHYGFDLEQFTAITMYFKGYNVASDHYPPVYSEFRNPLFLKTFCEAYEGERIPASAFSLHKVMKKLIDKIANKIQADIDCAPSITKQAIDLIGDKMIQSKSYHLLANEMANEINGLFPGQGDSRSLYRHLKSSRIISEIGGTAENQIKVRFSYEKFSDYFFASELIERTDAQGLSSWITSNHDLPFNLLVALFSLYPEIKEGLELFDIIPTEMQSNQYFIDAYFGSLQWRTPDSFLEKGINLFKAIFNKLGDDDGRIDVLIPLVTIPNHPFNALYLDAINSKLELWQRDQFWTEHINALANDEDEGSLYSILKWTVAISDQHLSKDQVYLVSILLTWCLSSTVWKFRDEVTKVLILLLKNHTDVLIEIISKFNEVNDPYIKERIFAVAAGVVMRIHDKSEISQIAETVYRLCFDRDDVPIHILLRDYARMVLETALYKKALPYNCRPEKFRPPYHSKWPDNIWSKEKVDEFEKLDGCFFLMESIRPEGYGMYGDFGRYIMGSNLNSFTKYRLNEAPPPFTGYVNQEHRFDHGIGRQWILQRIHELGWTPERFIENKYTIHWENRDRPYKERISKKYQWIGLHELLGMVSDNFHMCPEYDNGIKVFQGVWQVGLRDFDPSFFKLLTQEEQNIYLGSSLYIDEWGKYPDPLPKLGHTFISKEEWVFDKNIPTPDGLIFPNNDHTLTLLSGTFGWKEDEDRVPLNEKRYDMWIHIRSYLMDEEDFPTFESLLKKQHFYGNGISLPMTNDWMGEYPWRQSFENDDFYDTHWLGITDIPAQITSIEYLNENSEPHINKDIVSPSMLELADLFWSGSNLDFTDSNGQVMAFNPSLYNSSLRDLCVINKEHLQRKLKEKKKMIFWAIVGEKSLMSKKMDDYSGDLSFSGFYSLDNEQLEGGITVFNVRLPKSSTSDPRVTRGGLTA